MRGTEMELHYTETCRDCVHKHIGPALHKAYEVTEIRACGGCGRTMPMVRVSYWFPWQAEDPVGL